jgi:hypothetical protein
MAKWVVGLALACAGLGCSKSNPDAQTNVRIADGGLPSPTDVDGGLPVDTSAPDLGETVIIFHPRDMAGSPGAVDGSGNPGGPYDLAGLDLVGSPLGCGTTANRPLSWYQQTSVALNSSGPLAITVPDGVVLRGMVWLPSLPTGATYNSGLIQWTDATGNYSSTETVVPGVDGKSFTYSVVLAPGTYRMATRLSVQLPGIPFLSRYAFDSATLCEATTHDMPLPAVPPLSTVPVTVKSSSAVDPPNDPTVPLTVGVYMENATHTLVTVAQGSLANGTASLSMQLPSDTFIPVVQFGDANKITAPAKSGYLSTVTLPSAAPASRYDLVLPTLVKLTGSLTSTSGLTSAASPASLQCLDVAGTNSVKESSRGDILAASPSYRVYVRSGVSCLPTEVFTVQMAASGSTSANAEATLLTFPQGDSPATISADTVNNLTLPSLGTPITISGQLRDARGAALPNRLLTATGAPANGLDAVLIATVHSDVSGNFTLNLVPGSYDFEITSYDK